MYRFVSVLVAILVMATIIWQNQPETIAASTRTGAQAQEKKKTEENSKEGKVDKQETKRETSYNELNRFESWVILQKGTERAGTGKLEHNKKKGTYICRRCNAELYKSDHKFDSNCGWPAFDDEIKGAVRRQRDKDGYRTEILCANCDGHLGHVFLGERMTEKNTRHCVNSVCMKFIPEGEKLPAKIILETAAEKKRRLREEAKTKQEAEKSKEKTEVDKKD